MAFNVLLNELIFVYSIDSIRWSDFFFLEINEIEYTKKKRTMELEDAAALEFQSCKSSERFWVQLQRLSLEWKFFTRQNAI